MSDSRYMAFPLASGKQQGMTLLVSLVFLLLLTLIGISSMQSATLQEKMAGSITVRNTSFQTAESVLRVGETAVQQANYVLAQCTTVVRCAPPAESANVVAAGTNATSGVLWVASGTGFYGVQNIGTSLTAVNVPSNNSATLYRITAVAVSGNSRTILESVYAKY